MHQSYLRWPGGLPKALTLSYDDGVEQDERLLKLMEAHGVKGTFNLNSGNFAKEGTVYEPGRIHRPMTEAHCKALYASPNAEVACHGLTHPFLERLPLASVMTEVVEDRRNLETMTGKIVRGMAYPFGTYSDGVVEVLRAAGIAYCRTVISTEKFDLPTDPLRLPATCHHNNPRLMELAEKFTGMEVGRDAQLFYLWGHSYEFEANDNWQVIEQFLDAVSEKPDVWYATNIEIFDYMEAYGRLRFSADAKICENPTALDVWSCVDGVTVKIPAGKSVRF